MLKISIFFLKAAKLPSVGPSDWCLLFTEKLAYFFYALQLMPFCFATAKKNVSAELKA